MTTFSLVLSTLDRVEEVDLFLASIFDQTIKPTDLVIIDQNQNGCLDTLISKWSHRLPIRHYKVNFKGVCRARNYGAHLAKGELISFPDDDCQYLPNTIRDVISAFEIRRDCSVLIGMKQDDVKKLLPTSEFFIRNFIDLFKSRAETSQIFFRKVTIDTLQPYAFDTNIGPGSDGLYISNDETDVLIRIFLQGWKVLFQPKIKINHHSSDGSLYKTYRYAISRFYIIRKHKLGLFIYIINLIQPILQLRCQFNFHTLSYCLVKIVGRSGLPVLFQYLRNYKLNILFSKLIK